MEATAALIQSLAYHCRRLFCKRNHVICNSTNSQVFSLEFCIVRCKFSISLSQISQFRCSLSQHDRYHRTQSRWCSSKGSLDFAGRNEIHIVLTTSSAAARLSSLRNFHSREWFLETQGGGTAVTAEDSGERTWTVATAIEIGRQATLGRYKTLHEENRKENKKRIKRAESFMDIRRIYSDRRT